MLPLQGEKVRAIMVTQGVATGLRYVGPSARKNG